MSSKRHVRRKACGDKVRHSEEWRAQRARNRIYRASGERLAVYPCPFCNAWHLGHPKGSRKRGAA